MRTETLVLSEERNVTLTAFLQDVGGEFGNIPKRPAVLVLPGGGYMMCSDREAEPVALAYSGAGYQTFILRYSVGKHAAWPRPLEDYEEAMELIRSRAEEWKLYPDKVAVIGFSAGGHLAAAAATLARNKPNAAILGYPVTEEETAKACLPSAPDLVSAVNSDTCPCFLFATRTDSLVPISNSLSFTAALDRAGVAFESHIYAYGPHGFSLCDPSVLTPGTVITPRARTWVEDSIGWLADVLGEFGDGALTKPRCAAHVNGDHAPFLSADCTMGLLMRFPAAMTILEPLMKATREHAAERFGDRPDAGEGSPIGDLGKNLTLRDILAFGGAPAEAAEELDAALRQIPNA